MNREDSDCPGHFYTYARVSMRMIQIYQFKQIRSTYINNIQTQTYNTSALALGLERNLLTDRVLQMY